MKPGDIRHIHARDKQGNIIKTYTLHRTDRPYVHDLCDAYNAGRTHEHTEWFVTAKGELQLGVSAEYSRAAMEREARAAEQQRRDFNARNR